MCGGSPVVDLFSGTAYAVPTVMEKEMHVRCSECGECHGPDEVEFVNIEEDFQGRDLLTFVCPITLKETKAYVLG